MIKEQNKNGIENRPETHSSGVGDGKSRHFPEREYNNNNNNTRAQYDIIIIKRVVIISGRPSSGDDFEISSTLPTILSGPPKKNIIKCTIYLTRVRFHVCFSPCVYVFLSIGLPFPRTTIYDSIGGNDDNNASS